MPKPEPPPEPAPEPIPTSTPDGPHANGPRPGPPEWSRATGTPRPWPWQDGGRDGGQELEDGRDRTALTIAGAPPVVPRPAGGLRSPRLDGVLATAAWVVVAIVVLLTMLAQASRMAEMSEPGDDGGLALRVFEIQARYVVGTASIAQQAGSTGGGELLGFAASLDTGPVPQRLRYLVVASDLAGPAAGLEAAERLREALTEHGIEPSDRDAATLGAIESTLARRVSEGTDAQPDAATATLLRDRLGWFGELLLVPPGADAPLRESIVAPTRLLVFAVVALVAVVCVLGVAGFIGGIVFLVQAALGRWKTRLRAGETRGLVYAETFCAWFLLFIALSVLAAVAAPEHALAAGGTAMLLSLAALAWPVMRGIGWSQVRRDVGLHAGRGFLVEGLCGLAAYAMSLPLLAVGIAIMLGLMALTGTPLSGTASDFEVTDAPAHPLVEVMAGGRMAQMLALLVAAVIAPIVEEIAFRGILYRHLREGTRRLGRLASAVASMLLMSFIFAAIHPQGVFAIPVLMALACGFAFAREWRDSLVPGMVAHAVNNGAVVGLLFVAFS